MSELMCRPSRINMTRVHSRMQMKSRKIYRVIIWWGLASFIIRIWTIRFTIPLCKWETPGERWNGTLLLMPWEELGRFTEGKKR